ncbi:hypothetical protein GCM10008915_77910 [Bifidobacterium pullorum subsp. gallinarum]|jgi:DNA (cytosine-5)-methyltransferase 1|nr:hypothetical protein BK142_31570 [Paenibacillus glucanolyticus]
MNGERGKLIWRYLNIIRAKKPLAFIFENVIGLAKKHKKTLDRLITYFNKIGYEITFKILNSNQFNTPQDRKRVIVVGIRRDLGFEFVFPKEVPLTKTIRSVIGDLPIESGSFPNHIVTWTSPSPERIQDVIQNPRPNQFRGMRRLDWDGSAPTLTAHIAKDGREFLHPELDRRLTVRECLRIMSVPDDYIFPDHIPISHQYRAIGNGVEYNMGKALASSLLSQLNQVPTQICLF